MDRFLNLIKRAFQTEDTRVNPVTRRGLLRQTACLTGLGTAGTLAPTVAGSPAAAGAPAEIGRRLHALFDPPKGYPPVSEALRAFPALSDQVSATMNRIQTGSDPDDLQAETWTTAYLTGQALYSPDDQAAREFACGFLETEGAPGAAGSCAALPGMDPQARVQNAWEVARDAFGVWPSGWLARVNALLAPALEAAFHRGCFYYGESPDLLPEHGDLEWQERELIFYPSGVDYDRPADLLAEMLVERLQLTAFHYGWFSVVDAAGLQGGQPQ